MSGGALAFGGGATRGCVRFRPMIASSIDREIGPGGALDLARHLANCAGCTRESVRQRDFAVSFSQLPEVEPPERFTARVMSRVRAFGPVLRRAGACAFFTLLWVGGWIASRVPDGGSAAPAPMRFGYSGAWDGTAAGFGRSLLFVLSEVFSPRAGEPGPGASASPAGGATSLAIPALLVTIVLIAISLRIASVPRRAEDAARLPRA
jgi:hypothetical protein